MFRITDAPTDAFTPISGENPDRIIPGPRLMRELAPSRATEIRILRRISATAYRVARRADDRLWKIDPDAIPF